MNDLFARQGVAGNPASSLLKAITWSKRLSLTQKSDRNIKLLSVELGRQPDNAYLLYQLAIEYTSLDQTENAFQCLEKSFSGIKHTDAFAPNVVVDLLYTAMALKKFDTGIGAIGKSEEFLKDFPDYYLVRGLFYMNLIRNNPAKYAGELPKIEQSFQRCLALGETDKYKSVWGSGTFLANYNLGVFYHVFGNAGGAQKCFEAAAAQGYEPAAAMLKRKW